MDEIPGTQERVLFGKLSGFEYVQFFNGQYAANHDAVEVVKDLESLFHLLDVDVSVKNFLEDFCVGYSV